MLTSVLALLKKKRKKKKLGSSLCWETGLLVWFPRYLVSSDLGKGRTRPTAVMDSHQPIIEPMLTGRVSVQTHCLFPWPLLRRKVDAQPYPLVKGLLLLL